MEIIKSDKDAEIFFNALEKPSEPNDELKKAFKFYQTELCDLNDPEEQKFWIKLINKCRR